MIYSLPLLRPIPWFDLCCICLPTRWEMWSLPLISQLCKCLSLSLGTKEKQNESFSEGEIVELEWSELETEASAHESPHQMSQHHHHAVLIPQRVIPLNAKQGRCDSSLAAATLILPVNMCLHGPRCTSACPEPAGQASHHTALLFQLLRPASNWFMVFTDLCLPPWMTAIVHLCKM